VFTSIVTAASNHFANEMFTEPQTEADTLPGMQGGGGGIKEIHSCIM